jgi:ubiquinone/menaquinone biosynthesis C-methylase UbiE
MNGSSTYFPGTAMPDAGWWHALWPSPRHVIVAMGIQPLMRVVDLCCGDGYFTAELARVVGDGRVLAIDLDAKLLQEAQRVCSDATNCRFVEGDALHLRNLLSEPVDYVFIANTFHGVPDKTQLAHVAHSVLAPGGLFGIVNWYPLPREQTTVLGKPRGPATAMRMSPKAVREVVEPAGFTLERPVEFPPYHYGIVFKSDALKQEMIDGTER